MSVPYAHVRESAVKCRACMSVQYAQCGIVHSWKSDPCPQSAFVAQRPLPMHEGDPLSAAASDGRGRAVLLLLAIVLKWSYISCVGLLQAERRVGMADAFHCYDSVASRALNIHEEDASSLSSGSDDDVVEDVDTAEPRSGFSRWVRTCRVLRKLLGRGHGNHFLSEAYKTFCHCRAPEDHAARHGSSQMCFKWDVAIKTRRRPPSRRPGPRASRPENLGDDERGRVTSPQDSGRRQSFFF